MKSYFPLILALVLIISSCNKDEDSKTTVPHDVEIFVNAPNLLSTSLGAVRYNGNTLLYCGKTDDNGDASSVRSLTLQRGSSTVLDHYFFDELGRLAIAFRSSNGVRNSEIHKLRYGNLDSVYYEIHQFNWSNGVNVLEYQVGFGKWDSGYIGTSLYQKDQTAALEAVNEAVKLFASLSKDVKEIYGSELNSSYFESAQVLSSVVSWVTPNIRTSNTPNLGTLECLFFENLPNPSGSASNPIGNQDKCFNKSINWVILSDTRTPEYRFILFELSGGAPPYTFSVLGFSQITDTNIGYLYFDSQTFGVFEVDVTDNEGCKMTFQITLENFCSESTLNVSLSSQQTSAVATISGGVPPYQVTWSNGASGETAINLGAGFYTCTVMDADLCTATAKVEIEGKCAGQTVLVDIDNNSYALVDIGGECWIGQNLRVTRFSNGDAIPEVSNYSSWKNTSNPARAKHSETSTSEISSHGLLYNAYVIRDSRQVCPEGFRVPTREEFLNLAQLFGGTQVAGEALKSTNYWYADGFNGSGNNLSGWDAQPVGIRESISNWDAASGYIGHHTTGHFHMLLDNNQIGSGRMILRSQNDAVLFDNFSIDPRKGLSIRCLKD